METFIKTGKFAIVKYTEEDDALGVIPLCWVRNNGTTCLYPNATTESKRNKLLRDEALPNDSWTTHAISIMKSYATYKEAREKLRKAEETSNLESDEEGLEKRKRKVKEIFLPGEEDSSEDEAVINKKARLTSRVLSHPYPSLESFSPSSTKKTPEVSSFNPPTSLSPPSSPPSSTSFVSPPLSNAAMSSSPRGSVHCQFSPGNNIMRGKTSTLDIDRLWLILGQLQATAASQSVEISQLNQKLDLLLARGSSSNNTQTDEQNDHLLNSLPLTSMSEFDEFEEQLKNQEFRNLVVKVLATLGGKEAKLQMFNCMKRCLISELGMKFSYTGKPSKDRNKEKKRAFISTSVCAAIKSSVRKIYPGTTEEQFKINIGHWLQQAKNRTQAPRVADKTSDRRDP